MMLSSGLSIPIQLPTTRATAVKPFPETLLKGVRVAFFDALSASALPSWLTLARASGGTYFDAAPIMQTAGINAARFDHTLTGSALGLLVEPSQTNGLLYATDFSNAAWATNNATKTANYATAPDGSSAAARVNMASGTQAGTNFQQTLSGAGLGASQTNVVSGFVKSNTGASQSFALKLTHAAVADYFSPNLTATTSFQRFSFSQAFGAAGTGVRGGIASASGGQAADLVVWGLQIELSASFPSSFIATAGSSATRSADVVSISAGFSNNPVIVETMSIATGVVSRTLYNTGSGISALSGVWVRKVAVYRIGTPASILNAIIAGGAW